MSKNKSNIYLIALFIICIFLLSQLSNSACAAGANNQGNLSKLDSTGNDIDNDASDNANANDTTQNKTTEDSLQSQIPKVPAKKVRLIIRINVPHNIKAVDTCRIYPYPVAPPKIKTEIKELPIKTLDLQSQLKAIGYTAVTKKENPFPVGGWRMRYAFNAAAAKAGMGRPHTILTMYQWIDDMVPYLRPEVIRMNAIEKLRKQRYELAQSVFDEHKADLETQAFNNGLFPIDVSIQRLFGGVREGSVIVDQTNWWIVVIHKVPGLKYYWLWQLD